MALSPATRTLHSLINFSTRSSQRYLSSTPVRCIPEEPTFKIPRLMSKNQTAQIKSLFNKSDGHVSTSGDKKAKSDEELIDIVSADAEEVAIKLLSARAFTTSELHKKLCGKKFPIKTVNSVITDLKSRGLINDGLYAESFSHSKWQSSAWGPRRIKQALVKKGLSWPAAQEATQQVFEEEVGEVGEDSCYEELGMSKVALDHLLVKASKQWIRGGEMLPEKRKARMVRWLQYRGFSWDVTKFIVQKLESK